MRRLLCVPIALAAATACAPPADDLPAITGDYIAAWQGFHPSRALAAGRAEAALLFEDLEPTTVEAWLSVNRRVAERLAALPASAALDERVDRELLAREVALELDRWGEAEAHRTDPLAYSGLLNHALTPILVRRNLSGGARAEAVLARLDGMRRLSATARRTLVDGRPARVAAAVRDLRATSEFIGDGLVGALAAEVAVEDLERVAAAAPAAATALTELADWLDRELEPSLRDALGEARMARELALAYGPELTPAALETAALAEIETVRGLMAELAERRWSELGRGPAPPGFDDLVRPLLAEMEAVNAGGQQTFLAEFLDLIDRAERFLVEEDLVDLPPGRSLFTALSPSHFAGAAVGGVYAAGPFDPEAETLFYLPTVPDSAPEAVRDGFYRSFNTPFNTMIITHEIYPGHYLQLKAAASHPSPVRALFASEDFSEGWASFCEQMTLDAGWDGDRLLTRMAHLRKRLENAVRAHVAVQVHCRGWGAGEVGAFAVDTGLLPPQFADNLWHRAVLTPIQLPSYFVGFRVFDAAWTAERARLGVAFSARDFNDAVLACGGVPLALLDEALAAWHTERRSPFPG